MQSACGAHYTCTEFAFQLQFKLFTTQVLVQSYRWQPSQLVFGPIGPRVFLCHLSNGSFLASKFSLMRHEFLSHHFCSILL
uniref:Uncharacterized protein n=1 Tax=Rhizophora mucronata TaxID=61149 RepID=A0A2P2NIK1_RHIMU